MEDEVKKTPNGNELLFSGLECVTNIDKFREEAEKVSEAAFTAVFKAQDEGKLKWKRDDLDPWAPTSLVSKAVAQKFGGEEITIPVFLFVTTGEEGHKSCFLMLGSKDKAPCLNSADTRVKKMYTQVIGE